MDTEQEFINLFNKVGLKEKTENPIQGEIMSSEVVVPNPAETKKNSAGGRCLLWRMCPVVTLKEKDCIHKGSPSCKEFIRWLNSSEGRYTGDLR